MQPAEQGAIVRRKVDGPSPAAARCDPRYIGADVAHTMTIRQPGSRKGFRKFNSIIQSCRYYIGVTVEHLVSTAEMETPIEDLGNSSNARNAFTIGRFGFYVAQVLTIIGVLNASVLIALPHDKYLRYQALNDPKAPNSYWIYERIHFDPTPIDIAFIGTSRTGLSVHSRRLEEDLATRGIHAKAVNFYGVRNGINMQFVTAKELLSNRKVKLLVLEMTEREERKPHEFFYLYADPVDILNAPLLINMNYLADVARLPGRQLDLALQTELQKWGLRHPDFVPPPYEGPNLDHAEFVQTLDHNIVYHRVKSHTRGEMEALRNEWLRGVTGRVLPRLFGDLEYRLPRYYENKILDLARAHGTEVLFLYLPRYGGTQDPAPYEQYASRAQLINPWAEIQDYRLWIDEIHLNWEGAKRLTDYVAGVLADRSELKMTRPDAAIIDPRPQNQN
ncbi:MAG: hypothetical protein WA803_22705 [Steroidobacteraceae bacterium]